MSLPSDEAETVKESRQRPRGRTATGRFSQLPSLSHSSQGSAPPVPVAAAGTAVVTGLLRPGPLCCWWCWCWCSCCCCCSAGVVGAVRAGSCAGLEGDV